MRGLIFSTAVALLFYSKPCVAQQTRYEGDVKTILAYDKMYKAPDQPIVFVGSSSIRKWDDLQQVFGNYRVINRGIGGAVINDIINYTDQLIVHYKPRQVVLYVGDNDATSASTTADTIANRTIKLYRLIRAKLPDVPLIYISIKPSPSREKYRDKMEQANKTLKQFFSAENKVVFLDVYPLMLSHDGHYRPELFQKDMIHMLPEGYAIWEKAIKSYLLK